MPEREPRPLEHALVISKHQRISELHEHAGGQVCKALQSQVLIKCAGKDGLAYHWGVSPID